MNLAKVFIFNRSSFAKPSRLRKVSSALPDWSEKDTNSKSFKNGWHRFEAKIRDLKDLTPKEIQTAILYSQIIQDGRIKKNLLDLLKRSSHKEAIESSLDRINANCSNTSSLILPLSDTEFIDKFSDSFSPGVLEAKQEISDSGWIGMVELLIARSPSYKVLENKLATKRSTLSRKTEKTLIRTVVDLDVRGKFFEAKCFDFAEQIFVETTDYEQIHDIFDRYLGRFMEHNDRWTGKVAAQDYPPVKLYNFVLRELRIPINRIGENFRKFSDQIDAVKKIVTMLNKDKDDPRGDFWKEWMPRADKVIPKDSGSEVSAAFYFKNHVIVESAPKGRAAYVYTLFIFEQHVRFGENRELESSPDKIKSKDWRSEKFSKKSKKHDPIIKVYTNNNGAMAHTRTMFNKNKWKGQFSKVIEKMLE